MVDFTWEGKVSLNGSEVAAILCGLIPVAESLETQLNEETERVKKADNQADMFMATNALDSTASTLLEYKNLIKKLDELI